MMSIRTFLSVSRLLGSSLVVGAVIALVFVGQASAQGPGGGPGGERIDDVVEVCAQAVRSPKWKWKFRDLCRHIAGRESRLMKPERPTRFLAGNAQIVNRLIKLSRFKEIRPEIIIVQPGLSQERCTAEQRAVLAAAYSYLKETVGVDLDVVCSA